MKIRFGALQLFASLAFAQDAPPPPEVDAVLRARIQHFYQAHVDGKFRVADQVVAEDSKDAFFAAPKQKYGAFSIVRINYKDNFEKAEAVVSCLGEWMARGQRMKVNMVATSLWKVENGQWFWYALPVGETRTPFGVMHSGPDAAKPEASGGKSAPLIPRDPQAAALAIMNAVRADKQELMLSSFEKSAGEVKITNGMQGPITIRVDIDGRFPGLSFSVDKTELKAGDSATLKVVCEPKDRVPKPSLTARIAVEETNQSIPVRLLFAVPPDIEKLIPKELR